jgi:regulatory protein
MAFQRKRAAADPSKEGEAPARLPSPERLEQRARNVLLYQLSKGAKSKAQLAQILVKREIPDEIASRILDRFEETGLIDDLAFAETVVSSRRNFRGLSKSAIKRELSQKGVAAELIELSCQIITDEDELATAKRLAATRISSMSRLEPEVRTRRLFGYLQRKGYSSRVVFEAIRHAEVEAVKSEV